MQEVNWCFGTFFDDMDAETTEGTIFIRDEYDFSGEWLPYQGDSTELLPKRIADCLPAVEAAVRLGIAADRNISFHKVPEETVIKRSGYTNPSTWTDREHDMIWTREKGNEILVETIARKN